MVQEERQAERHKVRFKLVYDDGNTFNAGMVADVSEGGLFLKTALPLPSGTVVTVTPLDPAGDTLFEVKAKVVRVVPYDPTSTKPAGMGLKFIDLSDDERKSVVALIRKLEARAAEFQGELDPYLGVRLPSQPGENDTPDQTD